MKEENITQTLWIMAALSIWWGIAWAVAGRRFSLPLWGRIIAVLSFLLVGGICGQLKFAPNLGVVGLVDVLLWPIVALNGLLEASNYPGIPASGRIARVVLFAGIAFQSFMIWGVLLKRRDTGTLPPSHDKELSLPQKPKLPE